MQTIIREEARLIILKALAEQTDGRLNSELLRRTLETFGITRDRTFVEEELGYLERLGAVTLMRAGSVVVAAISAKGADHVERRIAITGVKRPSPER